MTTASEGNGDAEIPAPPQPPLPGLVDSIAETLGICAARDSAACSSTARP